MKRKRASSSAVEEPYTEMHLVPKRLYEELVACAKEKRGEEVEEEQEDADQRERKRIKLAPPSAELTDSRVVTSSAVEGSDPIVENLTPMPSQDTQVEDAVNTEEETPSADPNSGLISAEDAVTASSAVVDPNTDESEQPIAADVSTIDEEIEEDDKAVERARQFTCEMCGEKFLVYREIARHMNKKHLQPEFIAKYLKAKKEGLTIRDEMICKTCNRLFTNDSNMARHTMVKHGYRTNTLAQKLRGLHRVGIEEGRFQSTEDGTANLTSQESEIDPPVQSVEDLPVETMERKKATLFACSVCQQTYRTRRALMKHKTACHSRRVKPMKGSGKMILNVPKSRYIPKNFLWW